MKWKLVIHRNGDAVFYYEGEPVAGAISLDGGRITFEMLVPLFAAIAYERQLEPA